MTHTRKENQAARAEIRGLLSRLDFMPTLHTLYFSAVKKGDWLSGFTCAACNCRPFASLSAVCLTQELFQTPRSKLLKYLNYLFYSLKSLLNLFNIGNYFPLSKDKREMSSISATQYNGPRESNLQIEFRHAERGCLRMNEANETGEMFLSPTLQYKTDTRIQKKYIARFQRGAPMARYVSRASNA